MESQTSGSYFTLVYEKEKKVSFAVFLDRCNHTTEFSNCFFSASE